MKTIAWRRTEFGLTLTLGKARFAHVVPDSKYPNMYCSTLPSGRLSDMANLAWTKNAVLLSAERELDYEVRTGARQTPQIPQENRGVFPASAPPMRPFSPPLPHQPTASLTALSSAA